MAFQCSKEDYQLCLDLTLKKEPIFSVERKRGNRAIIVNDKVAVLNANQFEIKLGAKEKKEVVSLIANVKKGFTKFLTKNGFYVEPIEQRHGSYFHNQHLFNALPVDGKFILIDVSHCYWRIAYLLGYISERTYSNTLKKKDGMKLWRNMALACTIAPKTREYYWHKVKIMEISEDTSQYQQMYKNIRYRAYNLMGDICAKIGQKNCFGYRTDGIFVTPEREAEVKKMLKKERLNFKTNKLVKISSSSYSDEKKKVKQF